MRKAEKREPQARCHGHAMELHATPRLAYQFLPSGSAAFRPSLFFFCPSALCVTLANLPFEDPLPHFPFGPFPRALCRPGSSS